MCWFGLVADRNQARLRVSIARSRSAHDHGFLFFCWLLMLTISWHGKDRWTASGDAMWPSMIAVSGNHLETIWEWPVGLEKRSSSAMRPNQKIDRELIERSDVWWGFLEDIMVIADWFLPSSPLTNEHAFGTATRERKRGLTPVHLLFLKKTGAFTRLFFSFSLVWLRSDHFLGASPFINLNKSYKPYRGWG